MDAQPVDATVESALGRALLLRHDERVVAGRWARGYGDDVARAVAECGELVWLLALACELGEGDALTRTAHATRDRSGPDVLAALKAQLDLARMRTRLSERRAAIADADRARIERAVGALRAIASDRVPGLVHSLALGAIGGWMFGKVSNRAMELSALALATTLLRRNGARARS